MRVSPNWRRRKGGRSAAAATDLELKNYGIPSWNGCRYPVLAAHDLEWALAKRPAPGCRLCGLDRCQRLRFRRPIGNHGRALNKRRVTPCEKSKFTAMRGNCWKHTGPRQLRRPLRTPATLKQRARWNWPKTGGISKTP